MKILHVFDHSLPLHSGYTFRSAALIRGQRALGFETLHVTSPRQAAADAKAWAAGVAAGLPAVEEAGGLSFARTLPRRSWLDKLPVIGHWREMRATAQRIGELIAEHRPDALHAHSPALNGMAALWAGRRYGLPVTYEIRAFWEDAAVDHGTTTEGSLRYRLTRWHETYVARAVDRVCTICEGLRQDLVGRGIPAEKITVIPNAVDVAQFPLGGPPDPALQEKLGLQGAYVLGFLGSYYAYEGLDLLLEAVPELARRIPEVRVLLVGGGPQEAALQAQAARLGIADRVVFVGRVPHQEVNRYYDLLDALVYPRKPMRLTELVTPLKPLEAMAQGRVLVASDVGGHRELIRDGETGLLFKAGDAASLVDAVVRLRGTAGLAAKLRQAGREFVEHERTWAASTSRYRNVFRAFPR
jgi:PEP-CTERM/exosortase A-associated glycosyltransferase